MMTDLQRFAEEDFCYLTTTGRVTGRPHTIEIWFALHDRTLFMLAGGGARADWVKNIQRTPQVTVRIAGIEFAGRARIVESAEEDALARQLLLRKYQPSYGGDLTGWGRSALPVAVDLIV